jgi:hypothetical protein
MSNWQEMLEPRRPAPAAASSADGAAVAEADPIEETAPAPDPRAYHPWLIQRGRTRPALLLDFRRFDAKSGLLIGCQMPYLHLAGIEYIGDRMVTLDFGPRQFVIEGIGLSDLTRYLQQGTVLAIQEFSERTWPQGTEGSKVTRIVKVDGRAEAPT